MKIIALVPIKTDSTRLQNKNFRLFNGIPLYQMILKKLQENKLISKIIINTDSEEIKTTAPKLFSKVKIINRPEKISDGHITMNTLIDYDLSQISGEYFLQTHVTNPLLQNSTIKKTTIQA